MGEADPHPPRAPTMRLSLFFGLAALLLAAAAGSSRADLAVPQPRPGNKMKLSVEIDPLAQDPRLVVPRAATAQPRGFGAADADTEDGVAANPMRTAAVGASLALAVCFGGLWLVKRQTGSSRAVALLVTAGGFLRFGVAVWANAAPQFPKGGRPGPAAAPTSKLLDGKVSVEMVRDGDTVRLVLPKEFFEKLKDAKPADGGGLGTPPGAAPGAAPAAPANPAQPPKPPAARPNAKPGGE